MVSVDLKAVYLQDYIHQESQKYLCFVAQGKVFQVKFMCFGITTVPRVLTRAMSPVSLFLRQVGILILR